MDRQTLKRTLESHGSFLTVTQIADILGIDRGTARGLLSGLEYVPLGRKKLYLATDFIGRLMELRKT